jgi:zinc protease
MTSTSPGQQARVVMGGPTFGVDNPDHYVYDVIYALLAYAGRRLERKLVDEQAIASQAYAFYIPLTDVGVWGVGASMRDADVDAVLAGLKEELRILRDVPADPADLEEAKAFLRGSRLLNREESISLAEELSDGEVLGTYESTNTYIKRIMAVTADDIQRVARAYLNPDQATLVILRP